jgi:ABC-type Fe3+-citrate transport system substrate-binding protein
MYSKIAITIILAVFLSACGTDNTNQETEKAIAEACHTVKADGAVADIIGTEKKFVALAKLDIKYIGLVDIYTKWSQEMKSIALTETGRPKQYPLFPRSITLFCNE